MNIILAGAGKIGLSLARYLTHEGHDVTVIDKKPERIALINATLDVITICGEVDAELLRLAGASDADLLIAATNSDETNILCCMVARKLGVQHNIARVRQENHFREVILLQEELGLSLTINPERAAAGEISRVLRFPSAAKVESFAKGQAELVELRLAEPNPLCGMTLSDYHSRFGAGTLVCAVRRGDSVYIPNGSFQLEAGDLVSVVGAPPRIHALFRALSIFRKSAKYVLVAGAGHIGLYLTRQLLGMGIRVKLIDIDREACERAKDLLPRAEVVCCDGSRPDILEEEGLEAMDAFVALTGTDETNIILAAYARSLGVGKVIAKVNEDHYVSLASSFGLEEPVQPRIITAQQVLQYVRGMENSSGASGVETLRRIMDDKIEVLELRAGPDSRCVGRSLRELPIRQDVLLAAIIRDGKCIIPGGDDVLMAGDSVLAATTRPGLASLEGILKEQRP